MYKKLFSFLIIFSFFHISTMQASLPKLTNSSYQLPQGVSDNYLTVIHAALDNVGEPGSKPEYEMSDFKNLSHHDLLNELVLGHPCLSHLISHYIPEETIAEQQITCAYAIERNNYDDFKNSLEILKIYNAKFSENVPARNCIENNNWYYNRRLLSLACRINPRSDVDATWFNPQQTHIADKTASQMAIIQELINSKVNLNAMDHFGDTVIHNLVSRLHNAQAINNSSWITHFFNDIKYQKSHYRQIIKMLVDGGANIDEKSSYLGMIGYSPLGMAIRKHNYPAIEILVNSGKAGQNEKFWVQIMDNERIKLAEICTVTTHQENNNEYKALISLSPKINTLTPSSCTIS